MQKDDFEREMFLFKLKKRANANDYGSHKSFE
jgi:hypothetical protein